ncbi:hypothetical protein FIBSPDRAFT_970022, partial [Athelia psychrophila]
MSWVCEGCRRTFADRPALTNHENSCQSSNKRLNEDLDRARDLFRSRKRQRGEALRLYRPNANSMLGNKNEGMSGVAETEAPQAEDTGLEVNPVITPPHYEEAEAEAASLPQLQAVEPEASADSRPSRRQIQLPIRFRDMVPTALAELPPIISPPTPPSSESITTGSTSHSIATSIDSPRNEFGLFRRYRSDKLPTHDPEEHVDLLSLMDSQKEPQALTTHQYGPFNNQSSFQLGEWFINDGAQKSQRSFHKLIDIVGSASFSPADVRNTKWDRIYRLLGQNEETTTNSVQPEEEEGREWMKDDAGW